MSTDFEVDVDSKWIRQGEGIVKLPFVDFNINVLNSVYQHGQIYNKYLVALMGFLMFVHLCQYRYIEINRIYKSMN